MLKIDAHQHFWKYNPARDSWITDEMALLQQDFLPAMLQPLLQQHGFDGCVLVQSAEPQVENEFLLELAHTHEFVKGVVGWVDFMEADISEQLAHYARFSKLKGFRYGLQGQENRSLMLEPAFKKGLAALSKYNYTYDLLILPDQLGYARELVAAFPEQRFVIDHLAKPDIKNQSINAWKQSIKAFAEHQHVSCKVSGMVTEANWHGWQQQDFIPYLDVLVETFGLERLMFGSDWPVCLVAASYTDTLGIVAAYFDVFSPHEQALLFGGNAAAFYNLA